MSLGVKSVQETRLRDVSSITSNELDALFDAVHKVVRRAQLERSLSPIERLRVIQQATDARIDRTIASSIQFK